MQTITASGAAVPYQGHQYTASIATSAFEMDFFGLLRSLNHVALETYLATREAQQASQTAVIAEVATDYLTLSADLAILQSAKDTVVSGAASLNVSQKRFEQGIVSLVDVRQAETIVEQAQADVATDTTNVSQDKNALDLVLGSSVPETWLPAKMDNQSAVLTELPTGLPSELLLNRPDVIEAEDQLKSKNAAIGAARAAFFPTVSLTGSGGASNLSLSSLFEVGAGVWSFAPQISPPIFAGGTNVANLDYAKAQQAVYVAQYDKAIQLTFRDVANALARRLTIDAQISADQDQVSSAADCLFISQARYEQGSDTYLNVLTAPRARYAARQALTTARLIRSTNLVAL